MSGMFCALSVGFGVVCSLQKGQHKVSKSCSYIHLPIVWCALAILKMSMVMMLMCFTVGPILIFKAIYSCSGCQHSDSISLHDVKLQ